MNQSIDRFIHGGMLVLNENTNACEAARAMYERRVGSVVVNNYDGKMVGLVTDRDLSNQVLAFGNSPMTRIGEFMATNICTVTEDQSLKDVIQLMKDYGVRRIPVIRKLETGREHCMGMITLDDLIAEKAIDLNALSEIVSQQILKPARRANRKVEGQSSPETRAEHTLNRFYKMVSEKTKLDREKAEDVAFYLLKHIVRRLPSTGAAQMISQLPSLLHEDLLNLRAGPDRAITANTLLSEMNERFQMSPRKASEVMERFWDALEQFTEESGETEHVLTQLPPDMRALLSEKGSSLMS